MLVYYINAFSWDFWNINVKLNACKIMLGSSGIKKCSGELGWIFMPEYRDYSK